jgi:hypothetical protein
MSSEGEVVHRDLERLQRPVQPGKDRYSRNDDLGLQAFQFFEILLRELNLLYRHRGERNSNNVLWPDREDRVEDDVWFTASFFTSELDRAGYGRCHFAVSRPNVAARGDGLGVERDDVAAWVGDCDLWRLEPAGREVWGDEQVGLRQRLNVAHLEIEDTQVSHFGPGRSVPNGFEGQAGCWCQSLDSCLGVGFGLPFVRHRHFLAADGATVSQTNELEIDQHSHASLGKG